MSDNRFIKCTNCNADVPEHNVYCPNCQAKLGDLNISKHTQKLSPSTELKLSDYLSVGTFILGCFAVGSLNGSFLGALVFAVGSVTLTPRVSRWISLQIGRDKLGFGSRLGIGLTAFFVGSAVVTATSIKSDEAYHTESSESRVVQDSQVSIESNQTTASVLPSHQAVNQASSLKSMGAGVIFNAALMMAKQPNLVEQYLGKPQKIDDNPDGLRHTHNVSPYEILVYYGSQGSKWVTIEIPSNDGYAKAFPGLKNDSSLLKAIGLKPQSPDHDSDLGMRWENIQGIGRISVNKVDAGPIYIGIHLNKD